MKFIILLALLQALATGHLNNGYEIIPLGWNQFKRVNKIENGALAQIAIKSQYQIERKNNILYFTSHINVDENLSKVNKDILNKNNTYNNNKLLEHEKGHLVISLIHHYALIDSVNRAPIKMDNYKSLLRNIIHHFDQEKTKMNILYDQDTNHHINQEQQKEWDSIILNKISKYVKSEKDIQWILKVSKKI